MGRPGGTAGAEGRACFGRRLQRGERLGVGRVVCDVGDGGRRMDHSAMGIMRPSASRKLTAPPSGLHVSIPGRKAVGKPSRSPGFRRKRLRRPRSPPGSRCSRTPDSLRKRDSRPTSASLAASRTLGPCRRRTPTLPPPCTRRRSSPSSETCTRRMRTDRCGRPADLEALSPILERPSRGVSWIARASQLLNVRWAFVAIITAVIATTP
jgi:hypothetical protein